MTITTEKPVVIAKEHVLAVAVEVVAFGPGMLIEAALGQIVLTLAVAGFAVKRVVVGTSSGDGRTIVDGIVDDEHWIFTEVIGAIGRCLAFGTVFGYSNVRVIQVYYRGRLR